MNKANPMFEISRALRNEHGGTRHRAARAVQEATPIRFDRAKLLLAGHASPTLDEICELARMVDARVQVVVNMPKQSGGVAA